MIARLLASGLVDVVGPSEVEPAPEASEAPAMTLQELKDMRAADLRKLMRKVRRRMTWGFGSWSWGLLERAVASGGTRRLTLPRRILFDPMAVIAND